VGTVIVLLILILAVARAIFGGERFLPALGKVTAVFAIIYAVFTAAVAVLVNL
jgi:hypothetical protein